MKKKWLIFFIIIVITILSISYFSFKKTKVSAIKIKKEDYTEQILVTGTIQAKNFSTLTSGINGIIENIYIREGEPIFKGDIIAKLDTQEIEANIREAEATYQKSEYNLEIINSVDIENARTNLKSALLNYNIAKDEYLKYESLFEKNYINKLDYNIKKNAFINSETLLKNSENNLKTLEKTGATYKAALENTKAARDALTALNKTLLKYYIYAPYNGYITARYVEVGQSVAPYTEMFDVSSNTDKIVSINLDEKYINRVQINSQIKIYPYADISKYSLGKLYYIGINIDNSFGTLEIRGTIDDVLPEFLFNSTVNVIIEGRKFSDAILLQNIYVIEKKNKNFVYLLQNGKSKLIEVEVVPVIDGFIVVDGLEDNSIILLPKNLTEGVRVNPQFNL
ncbi:efflux RND transporter periplasmic adaptor subunit [Cetobacterium sp. 8H]|uniref:efflux RND transporter periplasmic adaptor subunit n=1 Tax=Cetobacterium sp. 8H TaxID=2759681 RepID=UPI00163C10E8|nr:efflux RND transporter periplasmic adaptor subunit [Cetobacterium sp. 8H]MBC2850992.1 efflux RND transporter periplasmic adaptor subunit [Cetobacterium sp. 8H]